MAFSLRLVIESTGIMFPRENDAGARACAVLSIEKISLS